MGIYASFFSKNSEYQCFPVCCPETNLLCQQAVISAMSTGHTTISVPSFIRIKSGSDGGT